MKNTESIISSGFRVTYICRSFLDYRLPVFAALDRQLDSGLTVIFSNIIPNRVVQRAKDILGDRAVALTGERALGFRGNITSEFSNSRLRIPWQPGILKEIEKSRPDVLIGDGFSQWTLAALVYSIFKKKPLVICYERTAHTERNAQWYRTAYRKTVLPFVDAMCVNGRLSREYARSLGMPDDRMTIGHMVADVADLSRRSRTYDMAKCAEDRDHMGIAPDALVFVSVSKLIKLKGIAEFLKGWAAFSAKAEQPVHLLIVGDGLERENLETACREHGITAVTFAGAVDYREVYRYYAIADIFFISTLEDNWSLVVPEAMSCGLPVLCSKYNGCWPELVTKENGWVFDPLDSEDTAACLEKCLAARDRLPVMGQKSREIVSRHTPEHAAKAILDACRIAVEKKYAKS